MNKRQRKKANRKAFKAYLYLVENHWTAPWRRWYMGGAATAWPGKDGLKAWVDRAKAVDCQ